MEKEEAEGEEWKREEENSYNDDVTMMTVVRVVRVVRGVMDE